MDGTEGRVTVIPLLDCRHHGLVLDSGCYAIPKPRPMSENTRILLLILLGLLLVALAAWYFDQPSPQMCVDGNCYDVF